MDATLPESVALTQQVGLGPQKRRADSRQPFLGSRPPSGVGVRAF